MHACSADLVYWGSTSSAGHRKKHPLCCMCYLHKPWGCCHPKLKLGFICFVPKPAHRCHPGGPPDSVAHTGMCAPPAAGADFTAPGCNGRELHIASLRPEGNVVPHTPLLHLTWLPPQPGAMKGGMDERGQGVEQEAAGRRYGWEYLSRSTCSHCSQLPAAMRAVRCSGGWAQPQRACMPYSIW
jgi:hypothetical protein